MSRIRTLAKEPVRENVEAVSANLVTLPETTKPIDVLWLHLFCHDLHTPLIQTSRATAAAFNRAVFERLKPGGCYVVVDHLAAAGSDTGNAQSLHRIDPGSVREEVEAAGFVPDAQSTILANHDDPHVIKVFDPSIKGETDRFAYRFVKPCQVSGTICFWPGYLISGRGPRCSRRPSNRQRMAGLHGGFHQSDNTLDRDKSDR